MSDVSSGGIRVERVASVDRPSLLDLYDAVGWSVYTRQPDRLVAAIEQSSHVVVAYQGDRLVGLARCVSDGVTIVYIQDILVHPDCQRRGLGRVLVQDCLDRYEDVRQKVLLTDDRQSQLAFYASLGFRNTRELEATPLNAFVRIEGATLE